MASKNKSRNKNVKKQRKKDAPAAAPSPAPTTETPAPPVPVARPESAPVAPPVSPPVASAKPPPEPLAKDRAPEVDDDPELQPVPHAALALMGLALPVTLWASYAEMQALLGAGEIGGAFAALSVFLATIPGLLLAPRLGPVGNARILTVLTFTQFLFPLLPRYLSVWCHSRGGGFSELLLLLVLGAIGPVSMLSFALSRLLGDPAWFHPLRRRLMDLAKATMAGFVVAALLMGQREITVLGASFLMLGAGAFWLQPAFMRLMGASLGIVLLLMAGPTFLRHSAQLVVGRMNGVPNAVLQRSRLGASGLVQEFGSPRPSDTKEGKPSDPTIHLVVAGVETRASQRPSLAALLFDLPHTLGLGKDILVLGGSVLLVTQPGEHFEGGWIVAEPDPSIASLIRSDPVWSKHVESGKIQVVERPWIPLLREKPQYFDLVLLDPLPARSWSTALPYTAGFLSEVKKVLKPAGVLAVGVASISSSQDLSGLWSPLAAGLLETFPQVLASSSTAEGLSLYLASEGLPFNAEELPYKLQMIVAAGDWTMVESSVLQTVIGSTPPMRYHDLSPALVESWRVFNQRFQLAKE